tara:strand:- start:6937 stop:7737 length:801 start_codon:yes stop_codon:yes gene_type:complete
MERWLIREPLLVEHKIDLRNKYKFNLYLLYKMSRLLVLSLEGNIGAGKTTLLSHLEKHFANNAEVVFMREPVHLWENIKDEDGTSMLSKFYADPHKYAFPFQIMAYTTRLHQLKKVVQENPQCKVLICERSLEADKHIFANMLHDDGLIEDVNYQIYQAYFSEYEGLFQVNGLVYVKADPDTCFDRVCKRSREGENAIELDYLQKCHNYHEKWLSHTATPCLKLDVNANICFEEMDEASLVHVWVNKVCEFVDSIRKTNNVLSFTH